MKSSSDPLPSPRLVSLDALRGFDMCWILGLSAVVAGLLKQCLPGAAVTRVVTDQFLHVAWAGFHFEDLIFPLFLFISGVSMAIAVPRRVERDGRLSAASHLVVRGLIIFALGVLFSGGLKDGLEQVRWLGVLQRIGIATALAGLLCLGFDLAGLLLTLLVLLLGYWVLFLTVSVPGVGLGGFDEGRNIANHVDKLWLPGRKYDGDHDPEGLLSTLPAVATALLGILAGYWMQCDVKPLRKLGVLVGTGLALLALGWLWHPAFPVVKKLWTSSFVLVAGGWSALLLGLFYWLVDVQGWRTWATPFVWVGANPIVLYLASGLGFFRVIAERVVGQPVGDTRWLIPATAFALMLLTARWLYKRGILVKV